MSARRFLLNSCNSLNSFSYRPHDLSVETVDHPIAAHLDQLYGSFLAGLEPNGGTGGNIQAITATLFTIEFECFVYFKKMKMGTDLNRSVTRVCYVDLHDGATGIQLDFTGFYENLSGYHRRYNLKSTTNGRE